MADTLQKKQDMPLHSLREKCPILIKRISHKNHYDYTEKHRHIYFEIMLFDQGGGIQLIDWSEISIKNKSCYVVFPQQIHLLRKTSSADGFVIQFNEEVISDNELKTLLQKVAWRKEASVIFENDPDNYNFCKKIIELFQGDEGNMPLHSVAYMQHLLQALLYKILSIQRLYVSMDEGGSLVNDFITFMEEHYKSDLSIRKYARKMNVTEKKLTQLSKKHTGFTPLQLIHNRILLEAKRSLILGNTSHKEIAYYLGFDSSASFSSFIKKKSGLTPTELQAMLALTYRSAVQA